MLMRAYLQEGDDDDDDSMGNGGPTVTSRGRFCWMMATGSLQMWKAGPNMPDKSSWSSREPSSWGLHDAGTPTQEDRKLERDSFESIKEASFPACRLVTYCTFEITAQRTRNVKEVANEVN
jgi:hypothetical protein